MLFIKNKIFKIKLIYFIINFLLFGMIGLIVNTISELNLFKNISIDVISMICCLIFSFFISKFLINNISEAILLSDEIKNHESLEFIGLVGNSETKITQDGGIIIINNKRVMAKTYNKPIDRGVRVLITDYDMRDDVYIVDYYPV